MTFGTGSREQEEQAQLEALTTAPATTSPPRFRRTRIAVSVVFGVLSLVLMVLWVRSSNGWVDEYWMPLHFSTISESHL